MALAGPIVAGAEWQPSGPFGGSVQSIAIDPQGGEILLAGARNGLLFKSVDGARSWKRVSFGRQILGTVQTLAIDPGNPHHYYAGISGEDRVSIGLWESADDGEHWQQSLPGLPIESLALWRRNPEIAAVGTRHGAYRRGEDGRWTRLSPVENPELQDITALAFDPTDAKTIYAGTPHLPWKTSDGGLTWHSIRSGMIDDSDVFSIAIDPERPQRVFASACSGIYRSESAGVAWKLLNGVPHTSRRTHIIAPDRSHPNVLYAGTTSGLLKSTDGGSVWREISPLAINSIAFSPSDSQTLYLATANSGVIVTSNGGQTFVPMNNGVLTRNVGRLFLSGSRMWASTLYEGEQGGLFRFDKASGWQQVASSGSFGGANVRGLAVAPDEETVYVATDDRLYRSVGAKWQAVPAPLSMDIRTLAFSTDGTLMAGTSRGLFLSKGSTWKAADVAGHLRLPIEAIYPSKSAIAIRTQFGAFVSRDGGQIWKEWPLPPSAGPLNTIALCGESALAATSSGLIRLSRDGAGSLSAHGLPAGTVSTVAFDQTNCRVVYTAQFGTLYRSTDGGESWTSAGASPAPASVIENLDVLPDAQGLIATFRGEGVFTLPLH